VVVGYGVTVPKGSLAVFTVDTEEEARKLVALTCPLADDNKSYYARELAEAQTLENLRRFSDKLAKGYALLQGAKTRRSK
jgi:hypothetical protein